MKIFIWLDDLRDAPICDEADEGYIARTYIEAVNIIKSSIRPSVDAIYISFDHDLGEGKSGYDFAKWLLRNGYMGHFDVHSMNPVGAKNIYELLTHYGWEYYPKHYYYS